MDEVLRSADAKVVFLDRLERKLLGAAFLGQVASSLSLFVLVCAIVGLLYLPWLALRDTTLALEVYSFFFLVLALFVVWSSAIAYVWRATILVTSLVVCLLSLAMVVIIVLARVQDMNVVLESTVNDNSLGAVSLRLAFRFLAIFGSILSLWLILRILIDACSLARTPTSERDLFIAGDPRSRSVKQLVAATLGIHPICGWIPGLRRRLIGGGLFVLAGIFMGIATIAVLASLMLAGPGIGLAYALLGGALYGGIAALFRFLAGRLARLSAENLAQVDKRPPILFLRSFNEDQVRLDRPKRGYIRGLMPVWGPSTVDRALLEEFTPLGPAVAIGVPGQRAPFGASRTYVSDSEWKETVAQIARGARAIVMVLDDTEGVNWELSHIVESGYLPKTICFLPPRLASRSEGAAQIIRKALLDNKTTLTEPLSEACVGWYLASNRQMTIVASASPSQASYICALRLFRESVLASPSLSAG
jgi:hypothetical protein